MNTLPDLIGHDAPWRWFGNAIGAGRLGGSFLFVGPNGVGKRTFALHLAKRLLCEAENRSQVEPACNACSACVQVDAQTHPDLLQVFKPEDRASIPLELLIGPRDNRNQVGFCRDVRLSPFRGRRKVALLHDADFFQAESANCLLKTLEEPPSEAVIILIGTSVQRQLPTIRSRCQTVRFEPPRGDNAVAIMRRHLEFAESELLESQEIDQHLSVDNVHRLLSMAGGDVVNACAMLDSEAGSFQGQLIEMLANPKSVPLSRTVTKYVEDAGKVARKRRDRMKLVFGMAMQHYRGQMRRLAAEGRDHSAAMYRMDYCMRAHQYVDNNANQATLIETWAAEIDRGHPV
ncbi:MAG: AAA family ATPase [Planctomycetota bacterium]